MVDATQRYNARYRKLREYASETPLLFREQAQTIYAGFTKKQRKNVKKLTIYPISALEFYIQWQHDFSPLVTDIAKAADSKAFITKLEKELHVDSEAAAATVKQLVDDRIALEKQQFVDRLYSDNDAAAQRVAYRILDRSDTDIQHAMDALITYQLHQAVAKETGMTIYDRRARLLTRSIQRIRERRQVKKLVRGTQRDIRQIDDEMQEIEHADQGLIARMFSLEIDLITVLGAHQSYEKALEKMTVAGRKSATKRLALYEKETSAIRSTYLDTVPEATKLTDVQQVAKEIDDILMYIFDLNNRQQNDLMKQFKRYRELVRERTRLLRLISDAS